MFKRVLPNHCQLIMVAERKRVDRLVNKETSTRKRVPLPPYRNEGGTNGFTTCKIKFHILSLLMGLLKPADDVGQQAKDNLHAVERQASAGL